MLISESMKEFLDLDKRDREILSLVRQSVDQYRPAFRRIHRAAFDQARRHQLGFERMAGYCLLCFQCSMRIQFNFISQPCLRQQANPFGFAGGIAFCQPKKRCQPQFCGLRRIVNQY